MLSSKNSMRHLLALAIVATFASGHPTTAQAQSLVGEGNAAGAQCEASGVNDSGIVVGACAPANASGPSVPWVAETSGTETILPTLASGQSCNAADITNGGEIIGGCKDASNASFAVTWNAAEPTEAPVKLQPLSLAGLLADVGTIATGYDQSGNVVGQSINGSGNSTAVLWTSGSNTPTQVSSTSDNCGAADVNNTNVNSKPSVALNCPNTTGTSTAKIAQADVLGIYTATNLPIPTGSTHCTVSSINDSAQIVGTCHFPAPDVPKATYWASPTSTPTLLNSTLLPPDARSAGALINNNGNIVFFYQSGTGREESGFWNTSTGGVQTISPLAGGSWVAATDLADNDTVTLISENSNQNAEAAQWTPTGGTIALGFYGGGKNSTPKAISLSGNNVAGQAEDSSEDENAVHETLP